MGAWGVVAVLSTGVLMGAGGDDEGGRGCASLWSKSEAPDMTGTYAIDYDDSLAVEIAIGGAVYTAEIGIQGGVIEIEHEGQPLTFELDCAREEIVCPSEATAKINAILSGRRGHILGFDTREGWPGWDVVKAQMAEAEIGDLIVEIRSATAGVGGFTFKFDHMAELTGRTADQIVAARRAAE